MRLMQIQSWNLILVMAICMSLAACGGSDDSPAAAGGSSSSGGTNNTGGSNGSGGTANNTGGSSSKDDASTKTDSGQYVFISASGDNTVRVYDLTTELASVKTIPVCDAPAEVRALKDGKYVSVICRGATDDEPGEIDFIDTASLTVAHTLAVGKKPTHTYVGPDGKTVFVGNDAGDSVSVIDTMSFNTSEHPTGVGHHKIAFATEGKGGALRAVYVSNITDQTISVLDPDTFDKITDISVAITPHGMDYSFVSEKIYNCSGAANNSIEVISTKGSDANTVVAHIPLDGSRCGHLEASMDGNYIYASMNGANKLARVDVSDNSVTYYNAGMGPDWFAEAEGAIWIVNNGAWTVTYINETTGSGSTLMTGPQVDDDAGTGGPNGGHLGLGHGGPWVFVANTPLDTVSAIRADHMHVHMTLKDIPGPSNSAIAGMQGGFPYPR